MTKEELAALLHGCEIGNEITKAQAAFARVFGLAVAFVENNDWYQLMKFRGAIDSETGTWDGCEIRFDAEGLLPDWEDLCYRPSECEARRWFRRDANVRKITAHCHEGEARWTYETDIPHATFDVMEDGEVYCRGIVFSVADLAL